MEADALLGAFQQMLYVTMVGVCFIVLPGLVVGLIVAVFQAATQINEMTLSFLPKLLVMLLVIALFGSWLVHQIVTYTQNLIMNIPYLIG